MAFVIVMHIGIVYGLAFGLSRAIVEVIPPPINADLLDEEVEEEEAEPPPPPPEFKPPPPDYVPPPEISITLPATTSQTAITAVTSEKKPPPPPPAPKAEKAVVKPRSDPKRPHRQLDYPSASRRLGEEGSVTLALLVGPDGKVAEIKMEKSSGFPRLDEAALKQVPRAWRFLPGSVDGKPEAMWYSIIVTWKLTE